MSTPPVIAYTFTGSPYWNKLEWVLQLKQIPYWKIETPPTPPRKELEILGITYRKVPVLSIGNDVYFDSYLAASALDRLFPENKLFAPETQGIQRALSFYWADRVFFHLVPPFVDWSVFPEAFLQDRGRYFNIKAVDPQAMVDIRPANISELRSHMDFVEQQLVARTSSSNYILNTPLPTYLDISVYFILSWAQGFEGTSYLFNSPTASHPNVLSWMSLFAAHAATKPSTRQRNITYEEAAEKILQSKPTSYVSDENEPLVRLGKMALGDVVEVTPTDVGKIAQMGKLISIDSEVVVLEVEAKEKGRFCRTLAPRIGFAVEKSSEKANL